MATTTETTRQDPLARHGAAPDVSALADEFELALQHGEENELTEYNAAFNTRYCRWNGQSSDGMKWNRNRGSGEPPVRPWDGRPDTRQPLADDVINAKVDLDVVAFWNALVKPQATHTTMLTVNQASELQRLVLWMRDGPLRSDLIEAVEYLSQMRNMVGYVVLMPYWRRRYGLRREEITWDKFVEQFIELAGQVQIPKEDALAFLPMKIIDPMLEDEAVAGMRKWYPYLKQPAARRIVRELREDKVTEFLYRELQENRPAIRVLKPGTDIFLPEETQDIQETRCAFIRTYYNQVTLEAMEFNDDWDEEFIAAAVETAGRVSGGPDSTTEDKQSRRIEIIEALCRQADADGVPGIFGTVFSPHAKASADGRQLYGKDYLLESAHGQLPLIVVRAEVLGPRPGDARGVPEVLMTQQGEVKRLRDALAIRAELETTPPRVEFGSGWSKLQEEFVPGGRLQIPNSAAKVDWLTLGGNGKLAMELAQEIQIEAQDRFGLPNARTETHPARWQARQMRNTLQWLLAWGKAFWQLAVLAYDEYEPDELAAVLGHAPLLTGNDLRHNAINLSFDARVLDQDWVKTVLDGIGMMMNWDQAGAFDHAKLVHLGTALLSPGIAEEATVDQGKSQVNIYKEVTDALQKIMSGFKPVLVEQDASSQAKLQLVQQLLQQNTELQRRVMPVTPDGQINPAFNQAMAENLQIYVKHLEFNVQEMVTSKIQGRLGVASVQGSPAEMK